MCLSQPRLVGLPELTALCSYTYVRTCDLSNSLSLFAYTSPAQPGPPVVTMSTTDSSITLTWNTTLHCFESEIFTFVVIWNEIGSPGTNTSTTVLSPPYTISGLQPGTSYEVRVHGVSGSGVVGERRVLTVTTGEDV